MWCAVAAHGGVRACLVGEATIQSHSPAVNSPPNAARICHREPLGQAVRRAVGVSTGVMLLLTPSDNCAKNERSCSRDGVL